MARVRDQVTWRGSGPRGGDDNRYFAGEVEPCINGQVAAVGAYFGQDVERRRRRLLGEQLDDGGWNCEAELGSTRSSFHTTICVLEGLLEYERAVGASPEVTAAREWGGVPARTTHDPPPVDGEVIDQDRKSDPDWTHFSFPTRWHYDVLRGLDYLRGAGVAPDERLPRPSTWCAPKRDEMAAGFWRSSTRARCRSRRTRARASRAAGTPCAPSECWTGIQHETNADAAGRRLATTQIGPFSGTADSKVA